MKIKGIIRLNEPMYEDNTFKDAGINVFDMEFTDGTSPDDPTIANFINIIN